MTTNGAPAPDLIRAAQFVPSSVLKDTFFTLGMHMWRMGYEKGLGDVETLEAVWASAPDPSIVVTRDVVQTVREKQLVWAGRWIENACPIVQLSGHRHAAAMMSTGMPSAAEVRAPWSSFMIEVPAGVLRSISHVLVLCRRDASGYESWTLIGTGDQDALHCFDQSTASMCLDAPSDPEHLTDAFLYQVSDLEARAVLIMRRIVVNTCVAMANSTARKIGKHPDGWTKGPRRGPPAFRVFRVGKPIEMDCRPAVQAYLNGARRDPLKVQFLVRGHWRHQPHGPRGELRKMIWIEPFWKGPEDAVILRRTHVLSGEKVAGS